MTLKGIGMMHPMTLRGFLLAAILTSYLYAAAEPAGLKHEAAAAGLSPFLNEPAEYKNMRMAWWRQARFGMFIHWGLYAEPAGQWNGKTHYGEWIQNEAQIPLDDYTQIATRFNPAKFNAADWVRIAQSSGVKYLVITSKHHDGFCLFDSTLTDYTVMHTPFHRDILKELSEECRKQGLKFCTYYSIMDWHHPDYLPRRRWEKRPAEGANFDRYVQYMKGQLKEIISRYEPAVLWFDGEWENTWTEERGRDLYQYVRSLKPDMIINNRVGKGRQGMAGTYDPNEAVGDFGTPEQEIPATGLLYDWETCMTMNDHWGYNKADKNYKSGPDLIRKLVDIVSKGGNFLLNVGPTAEGLFPPESLQRLEQIGQWIHINGDSIYGTTASRFKELTFGRSTTKGHRLYLHIFDWPADGRLVLPGLVSNPVSAHFLQDPNCPIGITCEPINVVLAVPEKALDPVVTVIELTFDSEPEIIYGPEIYPEETEFTSPIDVSFSDFVVDGPYRIHYTLDGSDPNSSSLYYEEPFTLRNSAIVSCVKIARDGRPVSPISRKHYLRKETPKNSNQ
ncbi:alpha-L-fucosidase [Anaerohalosphaeraceae bacterium U12dextr]